MHSVGDRIRIQDTPYLRAQAGHVRECIGREGIVTAVRDVSDLSDLTGISTIYEVRVGPYVLNLINADLQLLERRARIV
jgi:hypothetical protein